MQNRTEVMKQCKDVISDNFGTIWVTIEKSPIFQ